MRNKNIFRHDKIKKKTRGKSDNLLRCTCGSIFHNVCSPLWNKNKRSVSNYSNKSLFFFFFEKQKNAIFCTGRWDCESTIGRKWWKTTVNIQLLTVSLYIMCLFTNIIISWCSNSSMHDTEQFVVLNGLTFLFNDWCQIWNTIFFLLSLSYRAIATEYCYLFQNVSREFHDSTVYEHGNYGTFNMMTFLTNSNRVVTLSYYFPFNSSFHILKVIFPSTPWAWAMDMIH